MENERQPPSLPPHKSASQDSTTDKLQDSQPLLEVKEIPYSLHEHKPTPSASPIADVQMPWIQTTMPPNYQEAIEDMGTSLGYGQGMEYQYFDAPQPSQPVSQLRMANLQQRLYQRSRQQRQSKQDITHTFKKPQITHTKPLYSLMPLQDIATADAQAHEIQEAAETKQDTGAMKKVRVSQATFILSGSFIASRVLGLAKTSITAYVLGATIFSDAFYQAFTIPDTIFNIVAGGALSSAFIPVFTRYISKDKDEKTAWHIANASLTLATLVMVILAVIAAIFADKIVPLYNPPTTPDRAATIPIIVNLVRIMLLQSIILGAGSITNAVLNARHNFFLPAIGTVLYNAGSIIGLTPGLILKITGHGNPQFAVYSASVGIILGAMIQVGIQLPGLPKVGMHFRPSIDWRNPAVIQIGRQMLPRIFNAAMLSSSVFVDSFLIGRLGLINVDSDIINGLKTESIQAMQLMQLPLGVFGMALATATFPTLAEYVTRGNMDKVRGLILETLRGILFLSIPSCLGLILLGLPIVQTLLAHGSYIVDKAGNFTLEKANATVLALNMFALGLPAFATIEILTRSFYAMRDSKTPVIISVGQFILKIALSLILITPFTFIGGVFWGMSSLALSTTIASILEAIALFVLLHHRVRGLTERSLGIFAVRVLAATAGMSIAVFVSRVLLDTALNTTDINHFMFTGVTEIGIAILKLGIELMIGTIVYLRLARFFGIEEMGPIRRLLDRFKLSWIL
ncbi:murein biosynthesis integral membrane protein MurJ [Dictyobacter formicarum]|uniref:Probable lipid II flippase MurJ n=1 Tax=Dictyobacter formicarum TaxID=2778368 RepID=A0ABQ3VK58_9CHLR|nr:murein biosynthesis integral membrane protein MurJ [Dictyobacter formicarum]GHO85501.1 hypothetical protein KSZ_35070 [Dictyobacter formicarum]